MLRLHTHSLFHLFANIQFMLTSCALNEQQRQSCTKTTCCSSFNFAAYFCRATLSMLARFLLSSCVCPSICHKPLLYRNDYKNRTGFSTKAILYPSYTVFQGKSGISKNKVTSLWNFVPNSIWKILPRQVDHVVNKNRRRSSLLTIPTTVDASWLFTTRRLTVTL